jgi:hypothetical protein
MDYLLLVHHTRKMKDPKFLHFAGGLPGQAPGLEPAARILCHKTCGKQTKICGQSPYAVIVKEAGTQCKAEVGK